MNESMIAANLNLVKICEEGCLKILKCWRGRFLVRVNDVRVNRRANLNLTKVCDGNLKRCWRRTCVSDKKKILHVENFEPGALLEVVIE